MQHPHMHPAEVNSITSAGASRAALAIANDPVMATSVAELIDQESGLRALIDVLEEILAQAGDLIETRSPELVNQAYTALRYSSDASRQAE